MTDGRERRSGPDGAARAGGLSASQAAFASAAVRRARVFLALSLAGVAVGAGLAAWTAWRRLGDPGFPVALRAVIVILVLLNARQNLRQYRYARILAALGAGDRDAAPPGPARP